MPPMRLEPEIPHSQVKRSTTGPLCSSWHGTNYIFINSLFKQREHSGSMVECLTQDRGVAGLSL